MQKLRTVSAGQERFRPHFVIDERMKVRVWPEATACALGIAATHAVGRHCWQLFGDAIDCEGCRNDVDCAQPARRCARLPGASGAHDCLAWVPPALIANGPPGSALHESLLLRGALTDFLARHSLEDTLDAVRRACAADDCELFLIESGAREVTLRGCVGQDRSAFLECTRMPLGIGYPGRIAATARPLSTTRLQRDRRFLRDSVKQSGIRTLIGVPLMEQGRPIGYLGLAWRDACVPLDWGRHLLEAARPIVVAATRVADAVPQPPPPQPSLRQPSVPGAVTIRCLGAFAIVGNDRVFGLAAFPRRKALDLLRHLLLARGAVISRDALIERLWPECDPRTGANRLHVVLNALRAVLRRALPDSGAHLVQHRHGHYRIDSESLGPVDAFLFADTLTQARRCALAGDLPGALGCLERVLPLYGGDLFADAEDAAFEAPRQHLRLRHREAVRLWVDLHLRQGGLGAARDAVLQARGRATGDGEWCDALLREITERGRRPSARPGGSGA